MEYTYIILFSIFLGGVQEVTSQASHWYNDGIRRHDREKLYSMTQELVIRMTFKQRQLLYIQREHSVRISYEVGIVIGKIREKYKHMMDIYKEVIDRQRERNLLFGPGVWVMRPFYLVLAMEQMKSLEIEIDHLIRILETIPYEVVNQERTFMMEHVVKKGPVRPLDPDAHIGPPGFRDKWDIRTGSERDNESFTTEKPKPTSRITTKLNVDFKGKPVPRFKSQKELKQYYRERYESTEGPKDKALFLDHLYGLV